MSLAARGAAAARGTSSAELSMVFLDDFRTMREL